MKKRFLAAALLALLFAAGCGPAQSGEGSGPSADVPPTQSVQEEITQPGEESSADASSSSVGDSDLPVQEELPDVSSAVREEPAEQPGGQESAGTPMCTISISCAAILPHVGDLAAATAELVPSDGWLLPPVETALEEGESVFDLLKRVCRDNKLHMEFSTSPVYGTAYIEGLCNLYEFDCGDGSGWMYSVNGEFPNYGCSQYTLKDGDVVAWVYTCDFGADVGGGYAGGQGEAA